MGISARLVWFFAIIFEGGRLGTKNGKVHDGLRFISISVSDSNSTLTDIYIYIYIYIYLSVCVCVKILLQLFVRRKIILVGGGGVVVIFKPTIFSCLCNN